MTYSTATADTLMADPKLVDPVVIAPRPADAAVADPRWRAVLERDSTWDGAFVFAVTSTGIYCRSSCPSRRPRADRVRFFASGTDARAAGFRACLRCTPDAASAARADERARAIGRALTHLERNDRAIPLEELAKVAGLSRAHLQRAFTEVVGCSPHEWQSARRARAFRDELSQGARVSEAAYSAGYESLPRAYADAAQHLGMSPGQYREGAPGELIFFATANCALGRVLVATTARGICRIALGNDDDALRTDMQGEFPQAQFVADDALLKYAVESVSAWAAGKTVASPLPLDLRGTAFQQRVWRALTRIPRGETITYGELARRIGSPHAVRAVGSACGANPVAMAVPCHRVVRGDGALGGYRWGLERKQQLLDAERDVR